MTTKKAVSKHVLVFEFWFRKGTEFSCFSRNIHLRQNFAANTALKNKIRNGLKAESDQSSVLLNPFGTKL